MLVFLALSRCFYILKIIALTYLTKKHHLNYKKFTKFCAILVKIPVRFTWSYSKNFSSSTQIASLDVALHDTPSGDDVDDDDDNNNSEHKNHIDDTRTQPEEQPREVRARRGGDRRRRVSWAEGAGWGGSSGWLDGSTQPRLAHVCTARPFAEWSAPADRINK